MITARQATIVNVASSLLTTRRQLMELTSSVLWDEPDRALLNVAIGNIDSLFRKLIPNDLLTQRQKEDDHA